MNENIYRMVKYLKSINTNPDKIINYYVGKASEGNPAVLVFDKATGDICMWWGTLTHDKYKRMISEVKTDYLHLTSVLSK